MIGVPDVPFECGARSGRGRQSWRTCSSVMPAPISAGPSKLHRWLKEDGHDAFLDRDRDDGILPGEEWEKRLYKRTPEGRRSRLCRHAGLSEVGVVRGGDWRRARAGQ